jgi:hypothetical protein
MRVAPQGLEPAPVGVLKLLLIERVHDLILHFFEGHDRRPHFFQPDDMVTAGAQERSGYPSGGEGPGGLLDLGQHMLALHEPQVAAQRGVFTLREFPNEPYEVLALHGPRVSGLGLFPDRGGRCLCRVLRHTEVDLAHPDLFRQRIGLAVSFVVGADLRFIHGDAGTNVLAEHARQRHHSRSSVSTAQGDPSAERRLELGGIQEFRVMISVRHRQAPVRHVHGRTLCAAVELPVIMPQQQPFIDLAVAFFWASPLGSSW